MVSNNNTFSVWKYLHRFTAKQFGLLTNHITIAKIRRRVKLQARERWSSKKTTKPEQVHGLFLYHKSNSATERHFERLVAETKGLVVWHRLYNPQGGGAPQTGLKFEHPALSMPLRFDEMRQNGGLLGGFADVAILPSLLATGAPYVWVIEYDVEFAGHWESFFSQFRDNYADFLTTTLKSRVEARSWYYWETAKSPKHVPSKHHFRSFNPIMRLSRSFALAYVEALRDPNWRGHYEFTLPTIAIDGRFSVEEIGGSGKLCPPSRRGTIYTSPNNVELRGAGSFVWRPAIQGYYTERPDLYPVKGLLYHPCKNGVPDWESSPVREKQENQQIVSMKPISVAVIMSTCNGAEHLTEQLESLIHQTLQPDELIVGDDASTDETLSILRQFAEKAPFSVKIIERTDRLGYAENFMQTVHETNCDLICFCDQDDIWQEQKIQILVNAAHSTSALAFSHDLRIFDDRRAGKSVSFSSYFDHLEQLGLAPDVCIKGCGLAIRADLIKMLGWPPKSSIPHDTWITLFTTAMGQRALIKQPLIHHRIHSNNTSGWLISQNVVRKLTKSSTDEPFLSMLDLYLHSWPCEWIDIFEQRLATVGAQIDPVQAQAALRTLIAWRSSKDSSQ